MKKFQCKLIKADKPLKFGKTVSLKALQDAAREANLVQWTQYADDEHFKGKFIVEKCYVEDEYLTASGLIDEHLIEGKKNVYLSPKCEMRFSKAKGLKRCESVRWLKIVKFNLQTENNTGYEEPIRIIGDE